MMVNYSGQFVVPQATYDPGMTTIRFVQPCDTSP
jgi:hypothetical protein